MPMIKLANSVEGTTSAHPSVKHGIRQKCLVCSVNFVGRNLEQVDEVTFKLSTFKLYVGKARWMPLLLWLAMLANIRQQVYR